MSQAEIVQLELDIDQLELDNEELQLENEELQLDNDELQEASRVLAALKAAGVDNWEGYEMALEGIR